MNKNDIIAIANKYRNMSENEFRYGAAKCAYYEQIADNIENNIFVFEDDDENFETEEDIVEFIKEDIDSFEKFYDMEDLENMDMLDELPDNDAE